MLAVEHLQSAYGPAQVLFDIGFRVGAGEVVTLLGRNGMGKTTTIQTIMGLLPATGGSAVFDDLSLVGLPPHRIAQAGLGLVPEGRQIFPTLTVEENLIATAASRFAAPRWTLDAIYDFFPQLAGRRQHMGNELSGGEQQMLAIGRALMTNPKLLILDEATEGLAPMLRLDIWKCLARLKDEGQAILIVDKHLSALVKLADRHTIIEKGHVVWSGTSAALDRENRAALSAGMTPGRHAACAPLLTAPPSRMLEASFRSVTTCRNPDPSTLRRMASQRKASGRSSTTWRGNSKSASIVRPIRWASRGRNGSCCSTCTVTKA